MAVIAIDWDNTLFQPNNEWIEGAKEAIKLFREEGHKVIIHSCNRKGWIERNLLEHGLVVDGIWDEKGKPVADIYVDDRGYRFQGDWTHEQLEVLKLLGTET